MITEEDMAWIREVLAENPQEPMVGLFGPRLHDHGVCGVMYLRDHPHVQAAEEFGVDYIIPLI